MHSFGDVIAGQRQHCAPILHCSSSVVVFDVLGGQYDVWGVAIPFFVVVGVGLGYTIRALQPTTDKVQGA
jgi:hypothetical protein